jgi:hypothetical protein
MVKTISQQEHNKLCQVRATETIKESTFWGTWNNTYCISCGLRLLSNFISK